MGDLVKYLNTLEERARKDMNEVINRVYDSENHSYIDKFNDFVLTLRKSAEEGSLEEMLGKLSSPAKDTKFTTDVYADEIKAGLNDQQIKDKYGLEQIDIARVKRWYDERESPKPRRRWKPALDTAAYKHAVKTKMTRDELHKTHRFQNKQISGYARHHGNLQDE